MITELSREELIPTGARFRADYLAEQAGYTLGIAALDGKPLDELLPEGFMKEVQQALDAVNAARQDKALMEAEAREATRGQNRAIKKAKAWRRRVSKRASAAARRGKAIPAGLLTISQARSQPALASQVVEMTKLLEANLSSLHGAGTDALLEEGKALSTTLLQTDAEQEVKRLKELPDAVKEFYVQKALLYTGLKVINDEGQGLYSESPTLASRYNLSILHRRGGKKNDEGQEGKTAKD